MAMDVKGITWVGNIYQKFENMCLEEVEDKMFEDAVKYVENQMQTVGESVKKIYSDVMQDLLPPPSCDSDEKIASKLPIGQYTDDGFCKKEFEGSEKVTSRDDTHQTNEDSGINHDIDVVTCAESCGTDTLFMAASGNSIKGFMAASGNSIKGDNSISHARQCVGNIDVTSNLGSDESQQNKKMPASNAVSEITLLETDMCRTSHSCALLNENDAVVSKRDSSGVTRLASVAGCCNEIEIASDQQIPNVLVLDKSAEEKEMNTSSSSSVLFGDPDETWSLDATKIDTILDPRHKQDDEHKLEETCVMVTRDELRFLPKAGSNLKTNKKKTRQPFSLSKKSARKQEYEELAILHGKNAKEKGDCMENQKKLLFPDINEAEWELL